MIKMWILKEKYWVILPILFGAGILLATLGNLLWNGLLILIAIPLILSAMLLTKRLEGNLKR